MTWKGVQNTLQIKKKNQRTHKKLQNRCIESSHLGTQVQKSRSAKEVFAAKQ